MVFTGDTTRGKGPLIPDNEVMAYPEIPDVAHEFAARLQHERALDKIGRTRNADEGRIGIELPPLNAALVEVHPELGNKEYAPEEKGEICAGPVSLGPTTNIRARRATPRLSNNKPTTSYLHHTRGTP